MFFIIPCVDIYEKIDMRVRNFSVPPQEVIMGWSYDSCHLELVDICHIVIGIQCKMYKGVTEILNVQENQTITRCFFGILQRI